MSGDRIDFEAGPASMVAGLEELRLCLEKIEKSRRPGWSNGQQLRERRRALRQIIDVAIDWLGDVSHHDEVD